MISTGHGRVARFDGDAGLGEIELGGGTTLPFHCVAIADGSRTIDAGTEVQFRVRAALPGRWEAADIRPA